MPCRVRLTELYTAEHIVEAVLSVATAAALIWKLAYDPKDDTTLGWLCVLSPWLLAHFICALIDAYAAAQWYKQPIELNNPITTCLRCRGVCEASYQLLQHSGLLATSAFLPYYIADAVRRGAGAGLVNGSVSSGDVQIGTRINEGASISISTIMVPLWLAWVGQECLSVYYDARRPTVPNIANEGIRMQLVAILKSIKIRPRGNTFIFNLQATLVARMVDGAYETSWSTLFIFVWISVTFVLISLVCLGTAFLLGICFDHIALATSAYRRMLCGNMRAVFVVVCVVTPVFGNFWFYLLLALRLDGDESISCTAILTCFIVAQLGTVGMLLVSGEGALLPNGDPNNRRGMLTPAQLQDILAVRDGTEGSGTASDIEARHLIEQWEREKARYADIAPTMLLRQAGSTLYRSGGSARGSEGGPPFGASTAGGAGGDDGEARAVSLVDGRGLLSSTEPERGQAGLVPYAGPAQTWDAEQGGGGARFKESADGEAEEVFGNCEVCFEEGALADAVLLPCGHGGVCGDCATKIVSQPPHLCHMCRQRVLKIAVVKSHGTDEISGLLAFEVVQDTTTGSALGSESAPDDTSTTERQATTAPFVAGSPPGTPERSGPASGAIEIADDDIHGGSSGDNEQASVQLVGSPALRSRMRY